MARSPVAPKITTVSRRDDVSAMLAGFFLASGRKPPEAVLCESQLPARERPGVFAFKSIETLAWRRVALFTSEVLGFNVLGPGALSARDAMFGA